MLYTLIVDLTEKPRGFPKKLSRVREVLLGRRTIGPILHYERTRTVENYIASQKGVILSSVVIDD